MLLPQFTLRTTLVAITACALFCVVLVRAFARDNWAIAASLAVASLVVIVVVHACLYVLITLTARIMGSQRLPARTRQGGVQLSPDDQYLLPGDSPGGTPVN